MKTYRVTFTGRLKGAIGTMGRHRVTVLADNVWEARMALYETHDHIMNPRFEVIQDETP